MTLAPLILVVGPSGAGKDALMEGARRKLDATGRFHFARRVVTRPLTAGGEDHLSVTPEQFRAIRAAGGFLLSWEAHGLSYGIPKGVEDYRRDGLAVVANVSRSVIELARQALAPVGLVVVTAQPATLAERLRQRGRETAEDIRQRLRRPTPALPTGEDVRIVANDFSLEEGVDHFTSALRSLYHL